MLYAELILPLALRQSYHYRIAPDLISGPIEDLVGRRVVVSFGSKRFYTAIISSVDTSPPKGVSPEKLKFIDQILDEHALIPPHTLELWGWVASYYHCSLGQVMRVAIPSGLIPESKTTISLTDHSLPYSSFSAREARIIELLEGEKARSLSMGQIHHRLGHNPSSAISRLIELGVLQTQEQMHLRYKPLKNVYLQIAEPYQSDDGISLALQQLGRAHKQKQILLRLCEHLLEAYNSLQGSIPRSILTQGESGKASMVRSLVNKGILHLVEKDESRIDAEGTLPSSICPQALSSSLTLEHSVSYLRPSSPQNREEVITALVHRTIAEGGQVLLLSPSAQSMPSSKTYLEGLERVAGFVYYYHPLVSEAKRTEIYNHLSKSEEPCLVIGTRSAVFLPLPRLSLIIIDQEQEYLYKQQFVPPLFHARDIALWIGHQRGIKVLLSSQTPSAESLFNILRGKYSLIPREREESFASQIDLRIIDLGKQRKEGRIGYDELLSLPLRSAIEDCLSRSERVLLLQNRRGYAPYLLCQVCGERVLCPRCDVSLSYHHNERRMRCHYCDYISSTPSACPSCGAREVSYPSGERKALRMSGYGIERVEEELGSLYPHAKVLRLDSDSLQTQKKMQEAWMQISSGEVDIILGTQLIKNQPLWDNIGLVGVLQLDGILAYPDFRSYERAYQLLFQLYLHTKEKGNTSFYLQTSDPQHPFIDSLRTLDYDAFVKEQLSERNAFVFPPFVRMTYISFHGVDESLVEKCAKIFAEELTLHLDEGAVSGVQRPSVARISGQYIRQIVCKRSYRKSYLPERKAFFGAEEALRLRLPQSSKVRIVFDVDPL